MMGDTDGRARIAARAAELLGVKFRLHGRDPRFGLDCIGLVAQSLKAAGIEPVIPSGYSIRSGDTENISRFMARCGFGILPPHCDIIFGDIIVTRPHILQLHLMIAASSGFIHAHAGLRKVVFAPGKPIWPILQIYRLSES